MNPADKLKSFKEKINNATALNQELGELIGVELYDFIQDNRTLKDEFDRRVEYLDRLAVDPEFIAIQDWLYDAIVKILKLVNLGQVERLQKIWKNKLFYGLKDDPAKDDGTLPELYSALLKKENYYRLGDKEMPFFDGDIAYTPKTGALMRQYNNIETLFGLLAHNIIAKNGKLRSEYGKLIENNNIYWHKFNEKIHTVPIKIHLKPFVKFLLFCRAAHPRPGHEFYYGSMHDRVYQDGDRKLKEIKQYSNTVLDDLIESFRISDDGGDVSKKVELRSQNVIFDDNKAVIQVGERSVRLLPYKNEHYFCRAMYRFGVGMPADWSIIYQEMCGKEPEDTERNKRMVMDTMYRVNRRVKQEINTEDDLYIWRERTITRTF